MLCSTAATIVDDDDDTIDRAAACLPAWLPACLPACPLACLLACLAGCLPSSHPLALACQTKVVMQGLGGMQGGAGCIGGRPTLDPNAFRAYIYIYIFISKYIYIYIFMYICWWRTDPTLRMVALGCEVQVLHIGGTCEKCGVHAPACHKW
jgi:hypothetical protein